MADKFSPLKPRLIIFDLDGTLINAYPAIIRSFNYALRSLSYLKKNALIIRRAVGWGDENLLRPFVKAKDLKKAVLIYRRHHQTSLVRDSCLFPKVKILLRWLKKKGYKLAVASNRPTKFSLILIRHLKIGKYFDYILCADKLQNIKPHPEILQKIMQKFRVRPEETLYVADMAIDAQAARAARVKTIMVTTGSSTKNEIRKERPYRIIARIAELSKFL